MYCGKIFLLANYNAQRLMIAIKNSNVYLYPDVFLGFYSLGLSLAGRTGGFSFMHDTYEYYNDYVLLFLLESYMSTNDYGLLETAAAIGSSFNPTYTPHLYYIQLFRLYIYSCKLFYEYDRYAILKILKFLNHNCICSY